MLNPKKSGLLLAFSFLLSNVFTNSFNIDTKYPVIIKNTADGENNHFGISVLLINNTDPGIIVGSPKSNSTLRNHDQIPEPGVVWQCSFNKITNKCRVVVMDPTGNVQDPIHSNVVDRKDGGWLGGALAEDHDDFFACGNRWSNQKLVSTSTSSANPEDKDYFMNGICHMRPKTDLLQSPLPPVSNSSRVLPIIAPENQKKMIWIVGQAGFSIHTPQGSQEILLGAPGVNRWRGSVIKLSNDGNGNKLGNTFVWDFASSSLKLQIHSYFGFAINSGKFFRDADNSGIQYVAGAPRGKNLTGQVVVFKMPLATPGDILAELDGTQIGSYFGSTLCVADINGDGWDDLLVGAPLHTVQHKAHILARLSVSESGDEGTVFVYLSDKGYQFQDKIAINGHQPWSHFGTAIANLGDINNDGFDDIVIGAPYANEGSGMVYIYHGSQNGLLGKPVQEIEGKSFGIEVKGFGYSLSTGKDIDRNGYNDLAIGAYESGQVVILRSRPLISITATVQSRNKTVSFDTERFEIESCVLYTGNHVPAKMDFSVTITADTLSHPKRVFLELPKQSDFRSEHTYQEELYAGQESCTKFLAVVKLPLETTGKPVKIEQTTISILEGISVGGPTFFDIVSRFGEQVTTTVSGPGYQAFCKTCPLKDAASSKITALQLPLAVPCGDDEKCVSEIQIGARFLELKPNEALIVGTTPVLTLEMKIDNLREPAIAPSIKVLWNSKSLKKTPPECNSPSSNNSYTEIVCPLGRTLEQNKPKTISLELDMSNIDAGSMDKLVILIEVSTASDVLNPSTMSKTVRVPFIFQADIFIEGSKSSARFNLETLSPKTILLHNYEIGLDGPSSIAGAIVHFQIPVSVEHSSSPKTNFDVGEPTTSVKGSQTTITCYAASGSFRKFSRITVSKSMGDHIPDDYDSETEEPFDPTAFNYSDPVDIKTGGLLGGKTRKELAIECGDISTEATVKCMDVGCRITNMNAGARISVGFPIRVTSASLKNLFKRSKFSSVKYVSSGGATILGVNFDIQPSKDKPDNATAVSVIEEEIAKPVSHLIYLLGLFIGFLILALIVYCLYRSGVFDRKKPQATDEPDASEALQKQESQENDENPSEEE